MKQASVVVISVFLSSAVFCIAERAARAEQPIPTTKPDVKPVVTFHLLGDDKLTGAEAFKLPLKKLTLNEKPLLTGQDVLFYDRKNSRLFLAFSTVKRMAKAIGWKRWVRRPFVPLIVTVRGEKRFLCALSRAERSFGPFHDSPVRRRDRTIETKLVGVGAVTLLSPWGGPEGKDPRDDAVFLKALGEARKLNESVLARPRMSRDKVIDAARKMDVNYRQGSHQPKKHVPDSWKVASVTFCREVTFVVPSGHILGLVGPFYARCVWVVRFDASADPASKKAHWRPVACLVDDATGRVSTIHPPHFVKALTVPDTDVMAAKPIGTEEYARKRAGKHLKEITQVRFCDSLEVFPLAAAKKYQVWRLMRHVWICDGMDASGNRRQILLTAGRPGRPGGVLFKAGRFRLRRIIPVSLEKAADR